MSPELEIKVQNNKNIDLLVLSKINIFSLGIILI